MSDQRVGLGFDVHRSDPSRPLALGGIVIPDAAGLSGHSDGDAVCHAIADALLGAAALGDVGEHFPEDDPSVAGIAGTTLLARTVALIGERGFYPVSADVTVICERPAIGPHRQAMRDALAGALALPTDRVSVKATRPEGLGLSDDGIGCMALAVIGSTR